MTIQTVERRYRPGPCHLEGCPNTKRLGRGFRYCSDGCAAAAARASKGASSHAWRDEHRTELRGLQLWTRYRLTVEGFDALLAAQAGTCALCGRPEPGGSGTWHIDHDHACCPGRRTCGKCLRGLLCFYCNRHVLAIVEGPLLAPALAYLDRWKSRA